VLFTAGEAVPSGFSSHRTFMNHPHNLHIRNQVFKLYPEKVVLWKTQNMLLIADAHFGKGNHFRKSGLAVPVDALNETAARLGQLLNQIQPKACIFLGDLFHSHINRHWQNFEALVSKFNGVKFTLVRGNHDIIDEKFLLGLGFQIADEIYLSGFHLTHHPVETPEYFNICGHLHPGVKLHNSIHFTEKLPCFHLRPNQLILPSFGSFTGKKAIRPREGDRVFVIAGSEVVEIEPW